ncbi:MAG: Tat pathway signal protein [Rubritepida sp.]|nr:Tat pathway signal protein [Rubritepida sp.]
MSAIMRRTALALAGGLAMPRLGGTGLHAQGTWNPTRTITLVVGFPPGGRTDLAARMIRPGMQAALGAQVDVDNRGGEGGNTGIEAVMSAKPDGHTLLVTNMAPMALNPHTMEGMTLDPREMVPVGLVVQSSLILCAHPLLNLRDVASLRTWVASQAGRPITYGSTGTGSLSHLAMELLREQLGAPPMTHIPYRGSSAAMQDLIAGRFKLMFDSASIVAPALRAQQIRGLLATGRTRCPALPDIATAEQQGLANFTFGAWIGLFAPRGTSPEAVARLNAALNTALGDAPLRERANGRGDEPGGGTAEAMGRIVTEDYDRWGAVIRANNIRVES